MANDEARDVAAAALGGLRGNSAPMREVRRVVASLSEAQATVLITGEPGTGKQAVARAIHALSPRRSEPFVVIDGAELSTDQGGVELFGHAAGVSPGQGEVALGVLERVSGGTIFLENVSELSPLAQVQLLRLLQEGQVRGIGSSQSVPVDVRVIAASSVELAGREGFREDLYFRLGVVEIVLPPLRDRGAGDIELLARHFASRSLINPAGRVPEVSDAALQVLQSYVWPGNVGELERAVEQALVRCSGGRIEASDLPPLGLQQASERERHGDSKASRPMDSLQLYFDLESFGPAQIAEILQVLSEHFGGPLTLLPPRKLPPGSEVLRTRTLARKAV